LLASWEEKKKENRGNKVISHYIKKIKKILGVSHGPTQPTNSSAPDPDFNFTPSPVKRQVCKTAKMRTPQFVS
jgi:hypothetical protein